MNSSYFPIEELQERVAQLDVPLGTEAKRILSINEMYIQKQEDPDLENISVTLDVPLKRKFLEQLVGKTIQRVGSFALGDEVEISKLHLILS